MGWGYDTLEGNLSEEELARNRQDQTIDTAKYKFRDEDYYNEKEFNLSDIKVPVLSVANWVSPVMDPHTFKLLIQSLGRNLAAPSRECHWMDGCRVRAQIPPLHSRET